jgi:phenylalanine-4-hydroxylase
MLKPREFLNALAFRTYFMAQYLQHPEEANQTNETDFIQDIIGTAPLLSNPETAEFFHELGLASLGASEDDI